MINYCKNFITEKKPSKFTPDVPVEDRPRRYKSVREYFGDGADDCYIMDAKSSGNIGRYLNVSIVLFLKTIKQ